MEKGLVELELQHVILAHSNSSLRSRVIYVRRFSSYAQTSQVRWGQLTSLAGLVTSPVLAGSFPILAHLSFCQRNFLNKKQSEHTLVRDLLHTVRSRGVQLRYHACSEV